MDKFKFTEKERDAETNLDYFGARYYNSKIGLWLSVDPMAAEYPSFSPYNYCAANPLICKDYDGKRYGITIDHKNKTIVIMANYYVQDGDEQSKEYAQKAVDQWNACNGTYTDADGNEYSVTFNLNVIENNLAFNAANNDAIGNSFAASDIKFAHTAKLQGLDKNAAGVTLYSESNHIIVPTSKGNTNSRAHEIGHTLMLEDNKGQYGGDVMSTNVYKLSMISAVSENNASKVLSNGINQSMVGTGNGISVSTVGQYSGSKFYHSWYNRHIGYFSSGDGIKMRKQ